MNKIYLNINNKLLYFYSKLRNNYKLFYKKKQNLNI